VAVPVSVQAQNDSNLYLKECVVYAILDYFNCGLDLTNANPCSNSKKSKSKKKKQTPFRSLCHTTILSPPPAAASGKSFSEHESFVYATMQETDTTRSEHGKNTLSLGWMSGNDLHRIPFISRKPLPQPNDDYCCPFHQDPYDGYKDPDRELAKIPALNRYYHTCRAYSEQKLRDSTMLLNWLGNDIILNEDSFVVEGDKVYVLNKTNANTTTDQPNRNRVNFAACWNSGCMDSYVSVVESIPSKLLLVPPIPFRSVVEGGQQRVHLMLDFFQNNWSVTMRDREIPIPDLEYNDEDAMDSFRRSVHREYFIVDWDEETWEEKYNCHVNRVDVEGDTFISPQYSPSDGDEDQECDSDCDF
jgi:hypothetical protein